MIRKVDLIEDNSSGLVYTTGGRVLEIAMTKAQFNALAEERKANRSGSGFDEWGVYNATGSATTFFGSGTSVIGFQNMIVSSMAGGLS